MSCDELAFQGLSLTFIQCFWDIFWIHFAPYLDKAVTVNE